MPKKTAILSIAILLVGSFVFGVGMARAELTNECLCLEANGQKSCTIMTPADPIVCPAPMGCTGPFTEISCRIQMNDYNISVTPPPPPPVTVTPPPPPVPAEPNSSEPEDAPPVLPVKTLVSGNASSSKFIPECFLTGNVFDDKGTECRSINIYIKFGLNIVNFLFGIIGAVALLVFVYGGIMLIISQGNQEKIKTGTDAMLWAVIGLVIIFSAYILIGFMSEAIGVGEAFKLK